MSYEVSEVIGEWRGLKPGAVRLRRAVGSLPDGRGSEMNTGHPAVLLRGLMKG